MYGVTGTKQRAFYNADTFLQYHIKLRMVQLDLDTTRKGDNQVVS
jgi:hypothetical protein